MFSIFCHVADPTPTPDRWHTFLTWWRFWGTLGFCGSAFLTFLIISDMDGIPAYCGWRHPCPPWITLTIGAFPMYVWAAGGLVTWQLGRMARRRGRRPSLGIPIGALIFFPGLTLSLYLVYHYWWPNA
ncbi:hypothetical protein ACFXO9_03315 [Nocardia tengchongensis]|uniref:hypothetical protein n=1 Tax=Nocardia tengchongensis TaxID=2055889 RepID=UPI0036CA83E0